ncbi:hypothetical protein NQ176_g2179 [Zarea fungicola]|uniref:Uncharacterized protein n=1 Tax=Zarea fungicola TaxID=93591 RepID=A0ACC1NQK8_9HYPO|nr:hypothetical protein NQ176_g2179 [Lecanicillium fungicola]
MLWLGPSLLLSLFCTFISAEVPTANVLGDKLDDSRLLYPRVRIGDPGDGGSRDPLEIDGLFELMPSCKDRKNELDDLLKEIRVLHTLLADAFLIAQNWDYDTEIGRSIKTNIDRVSQFLAGGGLRGSGGVVPKLFCSENDFQNQDPSAVLKDKNGKEVVASTDPKTGEIKYVTVEDAFPIVEFGNWFAHWVPALNAYEFANRDDLCKEGETAARVSRKSPPHGTEKTISKLQLGQTGRSALLCPRAFVADPKKTHGFPSLAGAVTNYPTAGSEVPEHALERLLPISATLYHELYHLTDNGDTNDMNYHVDPIVEAVRGKRATDASRLKNAWNPETYAYAAMSLYIHDNAPAGVEPVIYVANFPKNVAMLATNK